MTLLNQIVQTLITTLERRRAFVVVLSALALFLGAVSGVARFRPPVLAPALDAVHSGLLTVFSGSARSFSRGPAGSPGRVAALELELARLREVNRRMNDLKPELQIDDVRPLELIPARVIGLDLDPIKGLAWLSAGSAHGVRPGDPVLTEGGLAGRVEAVSDIVSRVRLLRNPRTPVAVRDSRSRVLGVVSWDPVASVFEMDFVPKQEDVAVGDTLLSSGLGGTFPEGLPVGRVRSVNDVSERLLKTIEVECFAPFFRLEEGLVLQPRSPVWAASIPDSLEEDP